MSNLDSKFLTQFSHLEKEILNMKKFPPSFESAEVRVLYAHTTNAYCAFV